MQRNWKCKPSCKNQARWGKPSSRVISAVIYSARIVVKRLKRQNPVSERLAGLSSIAKSEAEMGMHGEEYQWLAEILRQFI